MRLPERYTVRYRLCDGTSRVVEVSAWNRTEAGATADATMRAEFPGAWCVEVLRVWRLVQPPERRRATMGWDDYTFSVRAVAAALAFVMPDWTLQPAEADWSADRQDQQAELKKGEASLHLSREWKNKNRLHVSAGFPHGYHNRLTGIASISVDPSKPAAQIARDITRRILTAYLPKLEEVLKERAADEAKKVACRKVVTEMAKAFRCSDPTTDDRSHGRRSDGTMESWTLYPHGAIHAIELSSYNAGEDITIREIKCTRAQALQLAALLVTTKRKESA